MLVTDEQKEVIERIEQMEHLEMAILWRTAPAGHKYFDNSLPYYQVFKKRLFEHFGGFTPEISKKIGW